MSRGAGRGVELAHDAGDLADRLDDLGEPLVHAPGGRAPRLRLLDRLADEPVGQPGRVRVQGAGHERHPRQLLQDRGVVDGLLGRLTPRERPVAGHQHHRGVERVARPEGLEDLLPGLDLVVALHRLVAHHRRARDVLGQVVGVGGAVDGDGPPRLRPAGGVGAVRVDDPGDAGEGAVEDEVGRRVGRGPELALDRLPLEVEHDQVLDRQLLVGYAAGLDRHHPAGPVEFGGVAEGVDGEPAPRDLLVRRPGSLLQLPVW